MGAMNQQSVFLTFDIDWLCDEYLTVTLELLKQYNVKATFFATHDSQLLKSLTAEQFEIGLHPNFSPTGKEFNDTALDELKCLYPQAVGTRSHTLLFGSRVLEQCHKNELRYESNIYLHKHLNLHPVIRSRHVLSIPFNWSDDKHIELQSPYELSSLPDLDNPGLNVFNFHPVHVFLNTEDYSRYENAKVEFNQSGMSTYVNPGRGIKVMLIELLDTIQEQKIPTGLLRELL